MLNKAQLVILWIMGIIISLVSIHYGIMKPSYLKAARETGFVFNPAWIIYKGYFISPFKLIVIPVIIVSILSIITLSSIRK